MWSTTPVYRVPVVPVIKGSHDNTKESGRDFITVPRFLVCTEQILKRSATRVGFSTMYIFNCLF